MNSAPHLLLRGHWLPFLLLLSPFIWVSCSDEEVNAEQQILQDQAGVGLALGVPDIRVVFIECVMENGVAIAKFRPNPVYLDNNPPNLVHQVIFIGLNTSGDITFPDGRSPFVGPYEAITSIDVLQFGDDPGINYKTHRVKNGGGGTYFCPYYEADGGGGCKSTTEGCSRETPGTGRETPKMIVR